MSRSLSTATATAAAKTISQPGHLMQVGFAFPLYLSSRGDVTFNGHTFVATNLRVTQIQEAANGNATVTAYVGNTDLAFGAACLNQAPQDIAVSVWTFYEGATGASDPVLVFVGTIDSIDNLDTSAVQLRLTSLNSSTLLIPRRRFTAASGFNHLLPAGRVITWNGVRMEIDRG